jgi:hypothetical protein
MAIYKCIDCGSEIDVGDFNPKDYETKSLVNGEETIIPFGGWVCSGCSKDYYVGYTKTIPINGDTDERDTD